MSSRSEDGTARPPPFCDEAGREFRPRALRRGHVAVATQERGQKGKEKMTQFNRMMQKLEGIY